MAHEVESMFYVGAVPWHQLGYRFLEPPSIEEALRESGCDWTTTLMELSITDERMNALPVILGTGHHAVVRDTDHSVLGVVGPGYHPVPNREAFQWFQPFLDAGQATLECAGSLKGGRIVWILARLCRDDLTIRDGDNVRPYLLLSNSHDGSMSLRVGFTPVRVVCMNTLSMSHRDGGSQLLRIKHTSGIHDALVLAQQLADTAYAEFRATAEDYRRLAQLPIALHDVEKYVKRVFGYDVEAEIPTRSQNIVDDVCERFTRPRGGLRTGTWWDGYNAVTDYLTHAAGRTPDSRLQSQWFGNNAQRNSHALETALVMSGSAAQSN